MFFYPKIAVISSTEVDSKLENNYENVTDNNSYGDTPHTLPIKYRHDINKEDYNIVLHEQKT